MHNFFHGWRRKAGVVTLVMALTVYAAWMRSRNIIDTMSFRVGSRQHEITSLYQRINWWSWQIEDESYPVGWRTEPADPYDHVVNHRTDFRTYTAYWETLYIFPALVLTLLSAYLILWKPRKRV